MCLQVAVMHAWLQELFVKHLSPLYYSLYPHRVGSTAGMAPLAGEAQRVHSMLCSTVSCCMPIAAVTLVCTVAYALWQGQEVEARSLVVATCYLLTPMFGPALCLCCWQVPKAWVA